MYTHAYVFPYSIGIPLFKILCPLLVYNQRFIFRNTYHRLCHPCAILYSLQERRWTLMPHSYYPPFIAQGFCSGGNCSFPRGLTCQVDLDSRYVHQDLLCMYVVKSACGLKFFARTPPCHKSWIFHCI